VQVFYPVDGTQYEWEYEEVMKDREAYEAQLKSGVPSDLKDLAEEVSEPVSVSMADVNRPAALGRCEECEAAGGAETVVIDATRIQYLKKVRDRYGKPAALVSFFHPNGQKFRAPPLSPYTLRCVCEREGAVLDIPAKEHKDDQTHTRKFKLIRRFAMAEDEEGEKRQACPGNLLMRWSCGRTTWPDKGQNVNAGLPVKGNEEFGANSKALFEVRRLFNPVRKCEVLLQRGGMIDERDASTQEFPKRADTQYRVFEECFGSLFGGCVASFSLADVSSIKTFWKEAVEHFYRSMHSAPVVLRLRNDSKELAVPIINDEPIMESILNVFRDRQLLEIKKMLEVLNMVAPQHGKVALGFAVRDLRAQIAR
jgi:hypothetical protein